MYNLKSVLLAASCLLLGCLRMVPVYGDADFEADRLKAAAANPPGVSLRLSLPAGRTRFHRGEVIPLTAAFAGSPPQAYQLNTDPGSRDLQWGGDQFHCDSQTGAVDPLRVYYNHEFGLSYEGPGPRFQPLSEQPITIPYTLNEWLRFDVPGRYRVFLTSSRVVDAGTQHDVLFFHGHAVASNAVEFDVLPDDPVWDAQTLRDALPLFNAVGYDYKQEDAREAAARTVRFLGTLDAGWAMVARYGSFTEYDSLNSRAYYQTRLGLYGFPQRDFIIQEMERQLAAPDFPVFPFFLDDLAQTQFLAAYPQPIPPFAADDPVRQADRQDLIGRRLKAWTVLSDQARRELAAAVSAKTGRAKALSLFTLLQSDDRQRNSAPDQALARSLVPLFEDLTPEEQNDLLDESGYWKEIRGPEMLPVLRRLYAEPVSGADSGDWQYDEEQQKHSLALHRLIELSPAEGRTLLLAEIKNPGTQVDLPTLCSLPDRTLPALDSVLAANLERSLLQRQGDPAIESRLVERYATAAVLPRLKADFRYVDCDVEANLLAYFLRTDPAYGAAHLQLALAPRKEILCNRYVLSAVAALHFGLDVERLAIAHLHDPDPQVAADAVKTLGAYGSSAAEAPLWARMREWHQQWAGKAAQIEPTENAAPETWELEYALTQALATAPGWLLNQTQLRVLEALSVTPEALINMTAFAEDWTVPVRISYRGEADQWTVVQYTLPSMTVLENKLAQFPAGTHLQLFSSQRPGSPERAATFHRLRLFLAKHKMELAKPLL